MHYVSNQLGEDNILLQVHDALYINSKVELVDMNHWAHRVAPGMNFEYEHITTIRANKRASRIALSGEVAHKQRIQQEELKAYEAIQ